MKSIANKIRVIIAKFNARLDPVYPRAFAFVAKSNNFSISHLQRHYLLGYKRACRLMDVIEVDVAKLPKTMTIMDSERYINARRKEN
jgi:DNA segregation ATPase FtsK/SpoIIIE-like protein